MPNISKVLGTTAMAVLLSVPGPMAFAQSSNADGAEASATDDSTLQEPMSAEQAPETDGDYDLEPVDTDASGNTPGDTEPPEGEVDIEGSDDGASAEELQEMMDAESAPATDGTNQTQGAGSTAADPGNSPGDTEAPEGDVDATSQSDSSAMEEGGSDSQGRAMMLDLDGFAQQIYERGYRQGYLSGLSDGREQMMSRMQSMQRMERDRLRGEDRPQQRGGQQNDMMQPGGGSERSGGSVIVLPPGVSPEAFVEELMRRSQ